jgi:hypothetical protein
VHGLAFFRRLVLTNRICLGSLEANHCSLIKRASPVACRGWKEISRKRHWGIDMLEIIIVLYALVVWWVFFQTQTLSME